MQRFKDSKAGVEILSVSPSEPQSGLIGYAIEAPGPESRSENCAIKFRGWVLTKETIVIAVEVSYEGRPLLRSPVSVPRPDVAVLYPGVAAAQNCGFQMALGVLGMPLEFELHMQAILKDRAPISLGVFRIRRQPLRSGFKPQLQPVMITCLGRTGSTWLMQLLTAHPKISVYPVYPFEARIISYYLLMLNLLSEPVNFLQSAYPNFFSGNIDVWGHPGYLNPGVDRAGHLFECNHAEQTVGFCQRSIEAFYRQVAGSREKTESVYFAEKHIPGNTPEQVWEIYPQAREIILVRDFRDMLCSVLAFNAKRGFAAFGREFTTSDDEYVRQLRKKALCLLNSWKRRSEQAHLLRYEDLILHPAETLKALLEYLGLDNSPSAVEGIFQRASGDTPELQWHRTSQDPRASIGRWKRDLSPEMQALCHEVFTDILEEFGYTREFYNPPALYFDSKTNDSGAKLRNNKLKEQAENGVSKLIALGERLFEEGKHQEAMKIFLGLTDTDPYNHENWNNLGVVSFSVGMLAEAASCFKIAVSLKSDFSEALENLKKLSGLKSTNLEKMGDEIAGEHLMEKAFDGVDVPLHGKCFICGNNVDFQIERGFSLREARCPICHGTKRSRDLAKTIVKTYLKDETLSLADGIDHLKGLLIYEAQASGSIHSYLSKLPKYTCSEYFENIAPGSMNESGIRCENLENLTFLDNSFDLVITQDVFEHISNPEKAFLEICRVLKPGGYHIFTIPFHEGKNTIRRVKDEDGKKSFLLPPVYHGDPFRPDGCLVYTDFGDDIIDYLKSIGMPTKIVVHEKFYTEKMIPCINDESSNNLYMNYRTKGEMLKYFLYNSIVLRSGKER